MSQHQNGFAPCHFRTLPPTRELRVLCRHPEVHAVGNEVSAAVCRDCQKREVGKTNGNAEPRTRRSRNSVAVIVATYNCGSYLRDCIESLIAQTADCEIVVVDDASTDETGQVLEEYRDHHRIKLLRHETNLGANAARNTGLAQSSSEWVVLADADAVYNRDFLAALLSHAEPDVDLLYGVWERIDLETGSTKIMPADAWNPQRLYWGNYITMCSLVRRTALPPKLTDRTLGRDGLDDWAIWLEMAEQGCRAKPVDKVLFRAFIRPEGKTNRLKRDPHKNRRVIAHHRRRHAGLIGLRNPLPVIIPAHEGLELTTKCIEHLAHFSGLPLSVVYVDNGSQRSVVEAVAECANSLGLPLAVIRNKSNREFSYAINQGLQFVGDCDALILNNDCFIGPETLERMWWALQSDPTMAAVGCLSCDDGQHSLRRRREKWPKQYQLCRDADYFDVVEIVERLAGLRSAKLVEHQMLAFFCTLLRGEAIRAVGRLDEDEFPSGLAADDVWCLRARHRGWHVSVIDNCYAAHVGGATFRIAGLDRRQMSREAIGKMREYSL